MLGESRPVRVASPLGHTSGSDLGDQFSTAERGLKYARVSIDVDHWGVWRKGLPFGGPCAHVEVSCGDAAASSFAFSVVLFGA